MDWLKRRFSQLRTNLYNRISSVAKKRTLENKHSVRSTIAGVEVGNFLVALSTTGLMALGVIPMSLTALIILAILLMIVGILGRYVDAVEDDVERLLKYEEHIKSSVDGANSSPSGLASVQQQSDRE